jgi:hypothetical protein
MAVRAVSEVLGRRKVQIILRRNSRLAGRDQRRRIGVLCRPVNQIVGVVDLISHWVEEDVAGSRYHRRPRGPLSVPWIMTRRLGSVVLVVHVRLRMHCRDVRRLLLLSLHIILLRVTLRSSRESLLEGCLDCCVNVSRDGRRCSVNKP